MKFACIPNVFRAVGEQGVFTGKVSKELPVGLAEPPRMIIDDVGVNARSNALRRSIGEDHFPKIVRILQLSIVVVLQRSTVEKFMCNLDRTLRCQGERTIAEDRLSGAVLLVPVLPFVRTEEDGYSSHLDFPRGIDTVGIEHGQPTDGYGIVTGVPARTIECVTRQLLRLFG